MTVAIRGATVFFSVVFYDQNDAPTSPSSASLKLAYKIAGASTITTIVLTAGPSNTWTATWDSSVADRGYVDWWAQSTPAPKSALQGNFLLDANDANPQT